ncbi:MAG: DNA polymerase Y family protein [Bacteroidota bacterium]
MYQQVKKRFVTIWFHHLICDWFTIRNPHLKTIPFVIAAPDHGRKIIVSANSLAQQQGVYIGMTVTDAGTFIDPLEVLEDKPGLAEKLLNGIAEWCIRYTPVVAIDLPGGLILDITGCAHLWGSERDYLKDIVTRLKNKGYSVRAAMADTIGAAWAVSRFAKEGAITAVGGQVQALLSLPSASLRLESDAVERLEKLGLTQIKDLIVMPRHALRRRFGTVILQRLDQATGKEEEIIQSIQPVELYQERLPCLEPIITLKGIEIALQRLLGILCKRLSDEQKGLRIALFKGYRIDNKIISIEISTNSPSHNAAHLFKLFALKFQSFEPAPGIELFVIEAKKVEDIIHRQESLWSTTSGLNDNGLSELLDRLSGRFGAGHIHRYLADEHWLPERSIKPAISLQEKNTAPWKSGMPRPLKLLPQPEPIQVTAPIPDYPPMNFRHRNQLHTVRKADGPERIEQEWWLQDGQHRDYYSVEDENGNRYWIFRLGHYKADKTHEWFLHGFFA